MSMEPCARRLAGREPMFMRPSSFTGVRLHSAEQRRGGGEHEKHVDTLGVGGVMERGPL